MHLEPFIDKFAEVGPIPKVAGASVDLVNDDTRCFPAIKSLQHPRKDGAPALRCGFAFLEPFLDDDRVPLGISLDGRALFLKRHTLRALFGCRDPNVGKAGLHMWE